MADEGGQEERLMITNIVCENFKSYAGVKNLGPFHKVRALIRNSGHYLEKVASSALNYTCNVDIVMLFCVVCIYYIKIN